MKTIIRGLLAIAASGLALPAIAAERRFEDERFDAADTRPVAQLAKPDASTDQGPPVTGGRGDRIALEEILVTGTHIRGNSVPAEVVSIDRVAIERSGFLSVEALVESLPQNFGEISPGGRFATEGGSTLSRINNDRVSSVNLRGLGAQSTLTLVDGLRQAGSIGGRVFDVSMLPLSMVERVDVVTGGRSAIYGADAVAGVANFITRREFDGLQTQLSYGGAERGGERLQVSQLGGAKSARGGFAAGYDYSRDWPFDLADVGLLSTRPTSANLTETSLQVQADAVRHAGFVSGHFEPNERIGTWANALYSTKRYDDEERQLRPGAASESFTRTRHPSRLYAASVGAQIDLSPAWRVGLTGAMSETETEARSFIFADFGSSTLNQHFRKDDEARVDSLAAIATGRLLGMELAIGSEFRQEKFSGNRATNGIAAPQSKNERKVHSGFAELVVPVVRNGEAVLLDTVELSAAARYDDYSDFGSTLNPQFGLVWKPFDSLLLRGSYSRSFRAPALVELSASNSVALRTVPDPRSSTGVTPLLVLRGDNPELGPEKAHTWNVGLELTLPLNTVATLSYFNVEYTDRIEVPAVSFNDQAAALARETRYPRLIDRHPAADSLDSILAAALASQGFFNLTTTPFNSASQHLLNVFPTIAVFDDRANNIAVESASGIDLTLRAAAPFRNGEFSAGVNATYTLEHNRRITETSLPFRLVNEVGKPADFRLRASVGWESGLFGFFGYINYIDGYANPYSAPRSNMQSWTTVDLTLRAELDRLERDAFRGMVVTLSVDNVLDDNPPRYSNSAFGVLYDSANADPFGRYLSVRFLKDW